MPLPKLPTRPAAILDLANIDASRQSHTVQVAELQPTLENFEEPVVLVEAEVPVSRPHVAPVTLPARPPAGKRSARGTPPAPNGGAAKSSTARLTKRGGGPASPDGTRKLFVLDTNVLLHDPSSLFRFEEHDIFLPMMTLEELDHQKKGMSEVARNARQVSRTLDALVGDHIALPFLLGVFNGVDGGAAAGHGQRQGAGGTNNQVLHVFHFNLNWVTSNGVPVLIDFT